MKSFYEVTTVEELTLVKQRAADGEDVTIFKDNTFLEIYANGTLNEITIDTIFTKIPCLKISKFPTEKVGDDFRESEYVTKSEFAALSSSVARITTALLRPILFTEHEETTDESKI